MVAYTSAEAVLALSNIDPEFEEHVQKYRSPPPSFGSLAEIRQHSIEKAEKAYENARALNNDLQESKIDIPTRDGFSNSALILKPASSSSSKLAPLVVLIFGGGFISGCNLQLAPYARGITKFYNAITVCISYRVAPEFPFPTAANDVWDAMSWLVDNTESLYVDLKQGFVIGGASAGANLTSVTAHRWIADCKMPPMTGVWLCLPALLPEAVVPEEYKHLFLARRQNEIVPGGFLDKQAIAMTLEAYRPDDFSPDFSPFNRPETFANIPPVYIQVAGLDPLRDDALIYNQVLQSHGIETKMDVYPGVPHGFPEMAELKQTKKFRLNVYEAFGWLLGTQTDSAAIKSWVDINESATG